MSWKTHARWRSWSRNTGASSPNTNGARSSSSSKIQQLARSSRNMWRASAARRAPSSSGGALRAAGRRPRPLSRPCCRGLAAGALRRRGRDLAPRLPPLWQGVAVAEGEPGAGARGNAASARGGLPGARGGNVDGLPGWPPVSASRRGRSRERVVARDQHPARAPGGVPRRACKFTFDTVPSPK